MTVSPGTHRRNFNPRSREGATLKCPRTPQHLIISIHAPAKERPSSGGTVYPTSISIHAPAKERPSDGVAFCSHYNISIHAPAKERRNYRHLRGRVERFQSTLPRRSDAIYHQFSFSNIQYSLTFCTNRTFQNLQISFDKCPFNTFCYFFRCESPDIFMYTVDSRRTRTT